MPDWQSRGHLEDHFAKHGRGVGARPVAEYDSSARTTLALGTIFSYEDTKTGLTRVGVYDRETELLTVLSDDDHWIINHFRCDEEYVMDLRENTYE